MKKVLKWIGIALGGLVGLLVLASVALQAPFKLPLTAVRSKECPLTPHSSLEHCCSHSHAFSTALLCRGCGVACGDILVSPFTS